MAGKTRDAAPLGPQAGAGETETKVRHRSRPCPICKAPSIHEYRPFCSRRCADVDLSRWLSGRYAIAGGDADDDEDGDQARAEDLVRGGRLDDM